jgi:radial spoke head protein 1
VGDWEADTATLSTRGWSSKRWGVGTQVFPDGSRYEGSWFDDKQNGEGKLFVCRRSSSSSSSSTPGKASAGKQPLALEYSGSWYNGRKHGFGKQTYANGDV